MSIQVQHNCFGEIYLLENFKWMLKHQIFNNLKAPYEVPDSEYPFEGSATIHIHVTNSN